MSPQVTSRRTVDVEAIVSAAAFPAKRRGRTTDNSDLPIVVGEMFI
jgi:hypothetical protein